VLTPRTIFARASSPKRISLADIVVTPGLGIRDWGFGRSGAGSGFSGRNSQARYAFTNPQSPIPNPCGDRLGEHRQDVVLAHDLVFDAFELVGAARVLAVDDLVADLDLGRAQLAVVQRLALTDGDHFTLGRLFLGVVGYDDAAGGDFVGFDRLDDHAVVERLEIH